MNMSQPICDYPERDDAIAGFAAGTLTPREHDAFGLHLLSCPECRTEVEQAVELRAAFRARARKRRRLVLPAAGLAAAAIGWVLLAPSAAQRLGRQVEAPELRVMAVRASIDSAAYYVERAVDAYAIGDYKRAALALQRAYAIQPDPGTAFVLGAARLKAGPADSARAAFTRVIDAGPATPYAIEARLYRAYAWLQLDRPDSAMADLRGLEANADPQMKLRATVLQERIRRSQ